MRHIQSPDLPFLGAFLMQDTSEYIRSTGSELGDLDLQTYRAFVLSEMDKWKGVVRQAEVKDE